MNEYIGLMIGAYIITRMIENIENKNLGPVVNVVSFVTFLVAIGCVVEILRK